MKFADGGFRQIWRREGHVVCKVATGKSQPMLIPGKPLPQRGTYGESRGSQFVISFMLGGLHRSGGPQRKNACDPPRTQSTVVSQRREQAVDSALHFEAGKKPSRLAG